MERRPGDLDSVRIMLGTILLVVSPSLAFMARSNALETIATLHNVQRLIPTPVTNTDSATLASAAYHAGHAMASMDGRWGPTGFMTLSSLAFAIGSVLVLWKRIRPKAA